TAQLIRRRRRLAVEPAELLVLDEHAGLDDGRRAAGRGEGGDLFLREDFGQLLARGVGPEVAGDGAAGAERGEVQGYVGGAAGGPGVARDVDHGHGRLRRNARGVAPDVVIEHHVADDEDAEAGDLFQERGKTFHGEAR